MLERAITDKILAYLHTIPNSWWFKCSDKFTAGLPDIMGSVRIKNTSTGTWHNYPIGIEVKQPGKQARPIQSAVMQRMKTGGYIVATVHSIEELLSFLSDNNIILDEIISPTIHK